MKLNLTTEIDAEKLDAYLTYTENGKRWSRELYFLTREKKSYLQPFLERALVDIQVPADYYQEDDWWQCAMMSVEYFREVFEIENPVEVLRDLNGEACNGDMGYAFRFDRDGKIYQSEILIYNSFLVESPPLVHELIGLLAHESWHAHQVDRVISFIKEEGDVIDLEAINPADSANRGAIYILSNIAMYEGDMVRRNALYRNQIAEAEAKFIQSEVSSGLVS